MNKQKVIEMDLSELGDAVYCIPLVPRSNEQETKPQPTFPPEIPADEAVIQKGVPIWRKTTLTIYEAAEYSGIGICKLREITDDDKCPFVMWIGRKRLIKREQFEKFINSAYSI